jgi:hypothetical protein
MIVSSQPKYVRFRFEEDPMAATPVMLCVDRQAAAIPFILLSHLFGRESSAPRVPERGRKIHTSQNPHVWSKSTYFPVD